VPLSRNLGTLTSWNPLGPSGPVMGLLYLLLYSFKVFNIFLTPGIIHVAEIRPLNSATEKDIVNLKVHEVQCRHCKVLSQTIFPGVLNILMFLCTKTCTPSDSTEPRNKRWLELQNSVTDGFCGRPRVSLYSGMAVRMLTLCALSDLVSNGSANHTCASRRNCHYKFRGFFLLFYI